MRVPLAILDLVPVADGSTVRAALDDSLALAVLADELGYARLWYAEHHNTSSFASSATSLLIGRAAGQTERIRVGAGGVMLPNHSPLMVAEYYGTLHEMFGDRIDLGLGRAPGTDPVTAAALRRGHNPTDTFVQDVVELSGYLHSGMGGVHANPGEGTDVPFWMLGSSLDGAQVAAALGLRYAFASHFAPQARYAALNLYRDRFSTEFETAQIDEPYTMAGVNVLVAPTDEEAEYLFTTAQQLAARIRTGQPFRLAPPVEDLHATIGPEAAEFVDQFQVVRAVGSPETVVAELETIAADLGVDELITVTYTHDQALRRRSYEMLAEAWF